MRIANSVPGLPSDYRCYGIEDKGGHVEAKVARDKKPQKCPKCGKGNAVVHGHVKRSACHVPVKPEPCLPVVDLRRYRCKRCGRTFFEPPSIVSGASPHVTVDLENWIVGQVRLCRSFAEVTRGCGASADIVQKVVDGGSGRLVDVTGGHDKRSVEDWLRKFPKGERLAVKVLACDMSGAFWRAAKAQLPNATVCPGKFHVVALAENAFEDARRRIAKRPGKPAADAKRIWKLLVADRSRLCRAPKARHWQSQEDLDAKAAERRNRLREQLVDMDPRDLDDIMPRPKAPKCGRVDALLEWDRELKAAYQLLQRSCLWSDMRWCADKRDGPGKWCRAAMRSGIPEFKTAARTLREHREGILNGYKFDKANALAEGPDNTIKLLKKTSYGMPTFARMRRRCLFTLGYRLTRDYVHLPQVEPKPGPRTRN